ncbi:MAG: nucleotidyltransferase family protein [Planctomycetaceae bacterium]|nr:nucleotidyltransferase family protein [Planctomycetaceae bacterium]
MEIQKDYKELLELFNAHKVEYLVVGGFALAFHGAPRFTGDIDLLIKPDIENAKKILAALSDFGFASLNFTEADFLKPDNIIQLGYPPVRIDIIMSISGVDWQTASRGKIAGQYGDVNVFYLGKEEFIANKKASGRLKDLADIEAIQKANKNKKC